MRQVSGEPFRSANMRPGLRKFRPLLALAVLASGLAACSSFDGTVVHGYVMDQTTISQIKPGESAAQVLAVMGDPTTTSTVGGGSWYYISQKTVRSVAFMKPQIVDQRVFAVYFDKNHNVTHTGNYGMKDGKVFDFETRTTPTTGKDVDFLNNLVKNLLRF